MELDSLPDFDIGSLGPWIAALGRMSAPHPDLWRVLRVIECLQDRPARMHVLLGGEPGTGKEGLARLLHRLMHPQPAPIMRVATLGRDESEVIADLFGEGDRPGALQRNAGSVLLEEALALSPRLQRLLHEAVRAGRAQENAGADADSVVVIALTDHDMQAAVAEGRFRHDLYHRLARVVLRLPPLRERPEDVTRAAMWMVNRLLRMRSRSSGPALTAEISADPAPAPGAFHVLPEAIEALRAHPWPGNFRELEAVIERAVLLYCTGPVLSAEAVRAALL